MDLTEASPSVASSSTALTQFTTAELKVLRELCRRSMYCWRVSSSPSMRMILVVDPR